ncbi:UNVERIFIED_CONTAM: hypothetical protein RKD43_005926 [Streptomyces graminofaciens]
MDSMKAEPTLSDKCLTDVARRTGSRGHADRLRGEAA